MKTGDSNLSLTGDPWRSTLSLLRKSFSVRSSRISRSFTEAGSFIHRQRGLCVCFVLLPPIGVHLIVEGVGTDSTLARNLSARARGLDDKTHGLFPVLGREALFLSSQISYLPGDPYSSG
ncbi:hypothetical protein Ssi02_57960 [Sinosporangium siamense]|uniref:Uncharacterized protein n=1 Tax=Sinosporangium siamense TaxID=1367973 RepID=A0A919V7X1_9ACTN|nr:hypothetical protein Ssi02_57960 [Sinosporangium siamense]